MRFLLAFVFAYVSCWASPVGYVAIETDSIPAEVFLDSRALLVDEGRMVVEAQAGKHFVSLFPPRKVYQAFRDNTPEQFWEPMRQQRVFDESRRMMSSYELGAVQVGTKWIYVAPEDTVMVRLSKADVQNTYRRDSGCLLSTFLGWTLLVGVGMLVSVILARLD